MPAAPAVHEPMALGFQDVVRGAAVQRRPGEPTFQVLRAAGLFPVRPVGRETKLRRSISKGRRGVPLSRPDVRGLLPPSLQHGPFGGISNVGMFKLHCRALQAAGEARSIRRLVAHFATNNYYWRQRENPDADQCRPW